jgi:hypothetical protein
MKMVPEKGGAAISGMEAAMSMAIIGPIGNPARLLKKMSAGCMEDILEWNHWPFYQNICGRVMVW